MNSYGVIGGWWSGDDTYVLRVQFSMPGIESLPQDLLLLYDYTDLNADNVPAVQDTAYISRTDAGDAGPDAFDPEPHRQAAGGRLVVANGALRIDGQPTTGGPANARAATGVIFLAP